MIRNGLEDMHFAVVFNGAEYVVFRTKLVTDFMTKAELFLEFFNKFTFELERYLL